MMSCHQITRAAGDYLERRLRLHERMAVLVHVAMCRGCRAYVDQLRATLLGLRSLPEPAGVPPSPELLEAFRRQTGLEGSTR